MENKNIFESINDFFMQLPFKVYLILIFMGTIFVVGAVYEYVNQDQYGVPFNVTINLDDSNSYSEKSIVVYDGQFYSVAPELQEKFIQTKIYGDVLIPNS